MEWVDPKEIPDRQRSPIRRRSSLSQPTELLHQAAALAHARRGESGDDLSLDFLLDPLRKLLDGTADATDVAVIRDFASLVSRGTLLLTEQLANQRGSHEWKQTASLYSAAL